jgi:hypothetical protein
MVKTVKCILHSWRYTRGVLPPARRAALAIALGAVALAACLTPGPTAPTAPPARPPTPAPQTPILGSPGPPPGIQTPTPPPPAPPAAADALALAEAAYTGREREDALSLLREAERVGDQAARYRAYHGAFDYLLGVYREQGQPPAQRAVLDAIEAVARSFPQYDATQFARG